MLIGLWVWGNSDVVYSKDDREKGWINWTYWEVPVPDALYVLDLGVPLTAGEDG